MGTRTGEGGPDRVVIMAGGGGTRLWPWTGPGLPKPLLPLGGGGRTLLRAALERAWSLAPAQHVHVLAAPEVGPLLAHGEPDLGADNIWTEPAARDTGPAVAFAMRRILREAPESVVVVAPADHRIADAGRFTRVLRAAAAAARAGWLVLLGVRPDHPSSRYGHVELGAPLGDEFPELQKAARFVEKPAADAARALTERGALWNAGLFVWRADAFWSALERVAPDIAGPIAAVVDRDERSAWERAPRTSIDYALMERAERVAVARLDAGWSDIGGWDAVLPLVVGGEARAIARVDVRGDDPEGSIVLTIGEPRDAVAVVLGRTPQFVVVGPNGILVAPRSEVDRVKEFVG